jgi:hypothetical protein
MADNTSPDIGRHLEPLLVEPVPEISSSELPETLAVINDHFRRPVDSYGAYLLREASPTDLEACLAFMGKVYPIWHLPKIVSFYQWSSLHEDIGILGNHVTVLHQEKGSVEFMMLPDSHLRSPLRPSALKAREDVVPLMFEQRAIDRRLVRGRIWRALGATIRQSDLLIFDHTKPHATYDPSKDRVGRSYYREHFLTTRD